MRANNSIMISETESSYLTDSGSKHIYKKG